MCVLGPTQNSTMQHGAKRDSEAVEALVLDKVVGQLDETLGSHAAKPSITVVFVPEF